LPGSRESGLRGWRNAACARITHHWQFRGQRTATGARFPSRRNPARAGGS